MEKITREIAEAEVNNWLDQKRVSQKKRETHKEHIDNLVDSIVEGFLSLNDKGEFVQALKFPLTSEDQSEPVSTLKYKPRIPVEAVQMHLIGVKPNDNYGMIHAYVAALTTKPKALIKKMDTEDYSVAYGIAIFFM
jgi:hypothetical protein